MPTNSEIVTRTLRAAGMTPALAIDAQGGVFVAWSEQTGTYPAVVVARLRGGQLELLGPDADGGGATGTRGEATVPALALDAQGAPTIAWQDRSSGNPEIYVRAWTGSAWEPHTAFASGGGVSGSPARYSSVPSIALDANGQAIIAWAESLGSRADIFVRRLQRRATSLIAADVGEHPGLTGFPAKLSVASQPALAVDAKGQATVAWIDNASGQDEVYLVRWNGRQWQGLGGSGLDGAIRLSRGPASSVTLRLDAKANPVLAWKEGSGDDARVQVTRWTGREWQPTGVAAVGPNEAPAWPSLALDADSQPVLALRSRNTIQVRRWTGLRWETLATHEWSDPSPYTLPQKRLLAFDARAGKACVAWIDAGTSPALHVACDELKPR